MEETEEGNASHSFAPALTYSFVHNLHPLILALVIGILAAALLPTFVFVLLRARAAKNRDLRALNEPAEPYGAATEDEGGQRRRRRRRNFRLL